MNIVPTKAQRLALEQENAKRTRELQLVPRDEWPFEPDGLRRVWRSRDFLVQEYEANDPAIVRLTVLRTSVKPGSSQWLDGITWDQLQQIKDECGWADRDAVEIYPSAKDVVNVQNMRHLWVMKDPLPMAWRKQAGANKWAH